MGKRELQNLVRSYGWCSRRKLCCGSSRGSCYTQVVTQDALCARVWGVVTTRQFLVKLLRLEALRRSSLTVFIAGVLRSCGIKLDRATPSEKMGAAQATRTFADGPTAIVRVESVARPSKQLQRLGQAVTSDAPWTLQETAEPFLGQAVTQDAGDTSEAPYGALGNPAGTRVASGHEIELYAPAMFTVSLKEAGVEKARVTAKARPGARRA